MGDNCNDNKNRATDMHVALIFCASHRFNISVCDILKENEEVLSTVRSIMVKFLTVIAASKLRKVTHFRDVLDNKTKY